MLGNVNLNHLVASALPGFVFYFEIQFILTRYKVTFAFLYFFQLLSSKASHKVWRSKTYPVISRLSLVVLELNIVKIYKIAESGNTVSRMRNATRPRYCRVFRRP